MLPLLMHGVRSWKNAKGIALLSIAAMAIGIGATTAIYTVIQAVLLNPLPYSGPDRYYLVYRNWRNNPQRLTIYSYPAAMETAERIRTAEAFGCLTTGESNLTFQGQPLHVRSAEVSGALMQSLGVHPVLGRWFNDGAREPGGAHVTVLSHSLWQRLGSDPRILGKSIATNGAEYTVVGVTPPSFQFPLWEAPTLLWIPIDEDENGRVNRGYEHLVCVAKAKAGVAREQVAADLNGIQAQLAREHPIPEEPDSVRVEPLLAKLTEDIRPALLVLLGAAGTLLLITCANVASVLLTRAVVRARETAMRLALGATTLQLGWQYFAEGLSVSVTGAAVGAAASYALVRAVLSLAGSDIPRGDRAALNGPVLAFTLAIAILSGVLCSLAPLWQARRAPLNEVLSDGARASAGRRSKGLLRTLVVIEIALAFGLVAAGAALVAQLSSLSRTRLGFEPDHVFTLSMAAPGKYEGVEKLADYQARLRAAIRAIPGVENAASAFELPVFAFSSADGLWIDGQPRPDFTQTASIGQNFISPGYFETLQVPLIEGRYYTDADKDEGEKGILPLIINQAAARRFFGNRDPIGVIVRTTSFDKRRERIVGIVGDFRNTPLKQAPRPEFYFANREVTFPTMQWVIRSRADSATLMREIRRAVTGVDSEQAIFGERTMREVISGSLARERLQSSMVSFFAGSALMLTVLGVYGVVSYSVRQRTTEIGTRMALGAAARDLIGMVIGDGLKMAGMGAALGLLAVIAVARIVDIPFAGAIPFVIAMALTGSLTALACLVPAWQAVSLSPLIAIRNDPETMWQRARREYRRVAAKLAVQPEAKTDEMALLTVIVDSTRQAQTFSEAIELSLAALRESLKAEFAALLMAAAPGAEYRCTRRPEWSLPADSLLLNRLRHYSAALPISSADLETWTRWASEAAPAHLLELQTLKKSRAALAVAVANKNELIGVLLLGSPRQRPAYTPSERGALRSAGAQLALLVENGRLTERIVEQERLKRELALAAEVQKRLFPEELPATATIHCAGICLPARGVGGDYYDFFDLGGGNMGLALADVAGKGIAAALIMSVVQASLRSLVETHLAANPGSLADLVARMNRLLHRSTGPNSYATFFYAEFDETTLLLRYVNAGHNPPFLLRHDGAIEELSAGGAIIGMFPALRYEEATVEMHAGDVLLAFSDGVPEAHDPAGEEFGEERLQELLRRMAHLPVSEMSSSILDELKKWMSDAEQYDDLTFIVMKVQ